MAAQNFSTTSASNKKPQGPDWATASIAFLLALVVIILYILPKYSDWQSNKSAALAIQQQIDSLNLEKTSVLASINTINTNQTNFNLVNLAIPSKPQLSDVFAHLEVLAKSSNLALSAMQGNDPTLTPDATAGQANTVAGAASSPSPTIGVVPVQIQLRGTVDNLKSFLTALELSLRLIDVQSINIDQGENNSLAFTVQLNTYYQK